MHLRLTAFLVLGLVGCGSESMEDPEPTGCAPAGALFSGPRQFTEASADSRFVYVGDGAGTLRRIRLADGQAQTVAQALAGETINDVAVEAGTLYFSTNLQGTEDAGGGGRVLSVASSGGAVTELARGLDLPSVLEVDATHVYWATIGTRSPAGVRRADGKLQRLPKAGGSLETLAQGLAVSTELQLDGADAYLAVIGGAGIPGRSGVLRVPKSGGSIVSLGPATTAAGLSVAAGFAYYTQREPDSALRRISIAGGSPDRTYATGLTFPGEVTVSAGQIYFVADGDGDGSVQIVAEPGGAPRLLEDHLNSPTSLTSTACGMVASLDRQIRLLPRP